MRSRTAPAQRVLAQARVRGARKIVGFGPWITVEGLPQKVNHSIQTYRRMLAGTLEVGAAVQLRVRHLVLDEGTTHERHVWDARVIGDVEVRP
jgi:hypothetical protein